MATRETIECRIDMAEDAMYRQSGELNRHLHELESRLESLLGTVHRELCERGQTPLEVKARRIVQAIEAFEAGSDLSEIRNEAERVTSLRGRVDGYELQIREGEGMLDAGPSDPPVHNVLVSAN